MTKSKSNYQNLLVSVLILTVGVWCALPSRGLLATFPFVFLAGALSVFFLDRLLLSLAAGLIAFFYALLVSFPSPWVFGLFALVSAFLGALSARGVRGMAKDRRVGLLLLLIPMIVSLLLSLLFVGGPFRYGKEREKAMDYLERIYPDQKFEDVTFYYDATRFSYCAVLSYANGDATLESEILFSDKVEDGFYQDYASFVLIKAKAPMIEALREAGLTTRVDEVGLSVSEDEPIPGSYGTLSSEAVLLSTFNVTFTDEVKDRDGFASACRTALSALREKDVEFGSITFCGLSGGMVRFTCEISRDTSLESIPDLIR